MSINLLLVAIFFISFIYFLFILPPKSVRATKYPHLPTPPCLSLLSLITSIIIAKLTGSSILGYLSKHYDSLIHIHIPLSSCDIVILTDAKYSRQFFSHRNIIMHLGNNLLIEHVIPHEAKVPDSLSPTIARAFSSERYTYFSKLTYQQVNDWLDTKVGEKLEGLDLFTEIQRLAIAMMARVFIGPDLQGPQLERFTEIILELDLEDRLAHMNRFIQVKLPSGKKQTDALWIELRGMIKKLVDNRINEKNNAPDFMNLLIKEHTSENDNYDYNTITKAVFYSVFAGATNTFATSAWSVVYLTDEKLRNKLADESKEYFQLWQDKKDVSQFLMSGSQNSTNFIFEIVRICSKGIAPRQATDDINFDDEYAVPEGWYIMFPTELASRNTNVFSNVDEFNPDRYLTEAKGSCEVVSFGAGRHPCTGSKLALIQIKTLVYNLFNRYEVQIQGNVTANELLPKAQPIGVFRPVKQCKINLVRKVGM